MSTILPIGFGHVRHNRQQPVQHVFTPHSASSCSHRSASARSRTRYSGTAGAAGSASTITTTTRSWVNALAWLEQLPHGEAFRAYWTTLEQACQLNLSNKPPSAHARPRGHPRIIRTEPAARLRPGRLQHMPRPFACLAQALLRPEGLLPRRPLQAVKPAPTGGTQYAHKQKNLLDQ